MVKTWSPGSPYGHHLIQLDLPLNQGFLVVTQDAKSGEQKDSLALNVLRCFKPFGLHIPSPLPDTKSCRAALACPLSQTSQPPTSATSSASLSAPPKASLTVQNTVEAIASRLEGWRPSPLGWRPWLPTGGEVPNTQNPTDQTHRIALRRTGTTACCCRSVR